jgi:hypothetical protein
MQLVTIAQTGFADLYHAFQNNGSLKKLISDHLSTEKIVRLDRKNGELQTNDRQR